MREKTLKCVYMSNEYELKQEGNKPFIWVYKNKKLLGLTFLVTIAENVENEKC